MLCKKCNHEIPQGALFCTNCGTPAAESEPETATPSQQPDARISEQTAPGNSEQTAEPQEPVNVRTWEKTNQPEEPQPQCSDQAPVPEHNPYINNNSSPSNNCGSTQNMPQQPMGNPYVSRYGAPINGGGMNARYNEQYHQTYGAQPPRATAKPVSSPTPVPAVSGSTTNEHVSVGAWIGVMLLGCVPIAGLIMMFVWAFGSTTKPSLKNYARAALILDAIAVALGLILFVILLIIGFDFSEPVKSWSYSYSYYY